MKKLLFIALMGASFVLTATQDRDQKSYKKFLDYFVHNSKGKCALRGVMPTINCSQIKSLSKEEFYTLLDAIDKSYDCAIFDYLGPKDEELCRAKCKALNATVSIINDCRSIEPYLYAQGCAGTEYGICSSLFKP